MRSLALQRGTWPHPSFEWHRAGFDAVLAGSERRRARITSMGKYMPHSRFKLRSWEEEQEVRTGAGRGPWRAHPACSVQPLSSSAPPRDERRETLDSGHWAGFTESWKKRVSLRRCSSHAVWAWARVAGVGGGDVLRDAHGRGRGRGEGAHPLMGKTSS